VRRVPTLDAREGRTVHLVISSLVLLAIETHRHAPDDSGYGAGGIHSKVRTAAGTPSTTSVAK
jgi:hypothetical protein